MDQSDKIEVFELSAMIIPFLLAGLLVALRWRISKLLQSPADFVAVFVAIDLGVLLTPKAFNYIGYVGDESLEYRLMAFSAIALFITVLVLEPIIDTEQTKKAKGQEHRVPWAWLTLGWSLALYNYYFHHRAIHGLIT